MKEFGRIRIDKKQVVHAKKSNEFGFRSRCMVCGEPSRHKVRMKSNVKEMHFCTKHFVQMFKMPPQRHPKITKKHTLQKLGAVRDFVLRQHMNVPYQFTGERLACHDYKFVSEKFFFSMYRNLKPYQADLDHVVSIVRVLGKHHAINVVGIMRGTETVAIQVSDLIDKLTGHMRMDDSSLTLLEMEATKFIEKCVSLPVPKG
jgi:hypothetical protein